MTDADISKALKGKCYLDSIHESWAGFKDLVPLLKVLRYKKLYLNEVYDASGVDPRAESRRINPMHWIR